VPSRQKSEIIPPRPIRVKIAAGANVDERCVVRFYRDPERVRPVSRDAIQRVLSVLGLRNPHAQAGA
jgi:DNA-binding LacI/PurR family transcriptional regulator